jgi:hypothetical protein
MISRETKENTEGIFIFSEKIVDIKSWGETKVYLVTGKIDG